MAIVRAIPQIINALTPQMPVIVNAVVNGLLNNIPVLLDAAVQLFMAIVQAIPQIIAALVQNLPAILQTITGVLGALPALIGKIFSTVIGKVVSWAKDMVSKGKTAASDLVKSVVNGIKSLPDKVKTIGKNLVQGLWNGIKNMGGWIKDKIAGFGKGVLDSLKGFFGIKSPSRVMRDQVGKMLAQGLAVGIEDNASAPMDAMQHVSQGVLGAAQSDIDGLAIERHISSSGRAVASLAAGVSGDASMLAKLDGIYERLGRLQMVTDTGALVGEIIDKIDAHLSERQRLVARGVY
jgi:phage-related protein